jgi:hypothetical protein
MAGHPKVPSPVHGLPALPALHPESRKSRCTHPTASNVPFNNLETDGGSDTPEPRPDHPVSVIRLQPVNPRCSCPLAGPPAFGRMRIPGAVAQLGERCNRTAEAEGSIPFRSTPFSPDPINYGAARQLGIVGAGDTLLPVSVWVQLHQREQQVLNGLTALTAHHPPAQRPPAAGA